MANYLVKLDACFTNVGMAVEASTPEEALAKASKKCQELDPADFYMGGAKIQKFEITGVNPTPLD